ncbi:MAG: hypothetical protein WBO06_10610 [Gammaproteobacteria bacterium]
MYKWLLLLCGVYFLGDPELALLGSLTQYKDYLVAIAVAFFAMPWIVSQFDS